jgi:hypothetical protein
MKFAQRRRLGPRISAAKLGEYLVAAPRRRRTIIEHQAEPRDIIVARYRQARAAITQQLLGRLSDDELRATARKLVLKPAATDWAKEDNRLSANAIERFCRIAERIRLTPERVIPDADQRTMEIGGVQVSLFLDLMLVERMRSSKPRYGGVLLVFSKTRPVKRESAQYVTTLVAEHLRELLPNGAIAPRLCQVVDVFHGNVWDAPRSHKSRMADVEAACQEIAVLWPSPPRLAA